VTGIDYYREAFRLEYTCFVDHYVRGALTDGDWECWRRQRLAAVLDHVLERSPFYRRHLAGVDPAVITPDSLTRLPFTTKDDLRREQHAVLSGDLRDAQVYYETTGTTGMSTPCPRDALEMETSTEPVTRSWHNIFSRLFGDRRPTVALMGPSELYAFGDTFSRVADALSVCHVKIWPESTRVGFDKALRLLVDLQIEVVVCAPALALTLAKVAADRGITRDAFAVRSFLVLGEVCTPAMVDNIRSLWDAETYNVLYGSQEAHAIATGCGHGRMHIAAPNYLVEVLDPATGRSLGATGRGELCLTMLVPGSKPLIRYRTGDLVEVRPDDCGCGVRGPVITVSGRLGDRIEIGGRELFPVDVEQLLLECLTGVLGYQVIIGRDGGADTLTLAVDQLPSHTRDDAFASVRARVRFETGIDPVMSVRNALDPITNTGSYVSWKAARIRDDRADADAEALAAARVAHRYADLR
jgi:phenylacetate-CoA ligase